MLDNVPERARRLVRTCRRALNRAIAAVRPGVGLSDVCRVIQETAEGAGYAVVRKYVGHGIGREMHEEPQIPNYVEGRAKGVILREGMVLAIEPMINEGTHEVAVLEDGWTAVTADGKRSAHWEHTVAVTADGSRVLTARPAAVTAGGPRLRARVGNG
jgi:methionyl aminopeptidase